MGGEGGPDDGWSRRMIERLCRQAFGRSGWTVTGLRDVNRGRGAFSEVLRVELAWSTRPRRVDDAGLGDPDRPTSVVAKLPVRGPNGAAARTAGAYRREALAYREVLPHSPVAHPRAHAIVDLGRGDWGFLLEDLTDHRLADQLDGLGDDDALRVAAALRRFHAAWATSPRLTTLEVRRNTLAGLAPDGLVRGLAALDDRWAGTIDAGRRSTYARLVAARSSLVDRFDATSPTLCHGDPRADNLVFDGAGPGEGNPVLFDWQQMAIQFGEADVAWLAATSLTSDARRRVERDLVATAGGDIDRYRLGLALPGLAVLMLAQRDLPAERARRFVAVSLQRIADALDDNQTAHLGG